MTLSHRFTIAVLALLAAAGITFGAGWVGYQSARAEEAPAYVIATDTLGPEPRHVLVARMADGDTHKIADPVEVSLDGRPVLIAQADTGSAAATTPDAGTGSASVTPIGAPLDELAALKAKYDALRAAKDSGSKDLIWFAYAALGAAVLRLLLAAINTYRGDKPKAWAKWTALGIAVPIALLTYYAAGAGLWAAIVMAGAGPGAIVINELLKRKAPDAS